ncbi:hypothetical protein [Candidatus Tisiphia endosymbiont of Hybos culiciformis]|uniref:hypothetical protein n=1 Tax=Candidatus Tisiphia endosymbiont of Hybos culiciformis TaxID=3139331 RepID=UPI003CCA80A8
MTEKIVITERVTMERKVIQQIYPNILLVSMLFSLSGCGVYGSSFTCRDASGLDCLPLNIVDQKINSGEIVEVELKERTKCKGRNCYVKSLTEKPDIKPNKVHKIKLQPETEQKIFKNGNLLYIK